MQLNSVKVGEKKKERERVSCLHFPVLALVLRGAQLGAVLYVPGVTLRLI